MRSFKGNGLVVLYVSFVGGVNEPGQVLGVVV